MRLILLIPVVAILVLVVLWTTAWGTLAIWFRLPGPEVVRWGVAGAFGLFGLATFWHLFDWRRWRWLGAFAGLTVVLMVWWNTLVPPADGDWALGVERQVTGQIEGDILTLTDVREFKWTSATVAEVVWKTASYDLSTIQTADLFMSYWAGPGMAHLMVSFGFADRRYLTWSVEVRREKDSGFSPVADFFKEHTVAFVAAEETDVIGLRSNIKGETVHLFRMYAEPEGARAVIESYVQIANRLAERPAFFNSVFTNCSMTVLRMVRALGIEVPLDWRIIANGYFPDYLYDQGWLNTSVPLEELYRTGDISERARTAGLTEAYSTAIREGVPPAP